MRFSPDSDPDLAALTRETVEAGRPAPSFGRRGGLDEHLEMLAREFSGQPALLLFHAATIVFIRRGLNGQACQARFLTMWDTQAEALATGLDSRWLVSACDTFADIAKAPGDRAIAALGSLFANTVKLYETERVVAGTTQIAPEDYDLAPVQGHHPLYDGLSAYRAGRGEMIRNLSERVERSLDGNVPIKRIVRELLSRAMANDTVYNRFAQIHSNPGTAW